MSKTLRDCWSTPRAFCPIPHRARGTFSSFFDPGDCAARNRALGPSDRSLASTPLTRLDRARDRGARPMTAHLPRAREKQGARPSDAHLPRAPREQGRRPSDRSLASTAPSLASTPPHSPRPPPHSPRPPPHSPRPPFTRLDRPHSPRRPLTRLDRPSLASTALASSTRLQRALLDPREQRIRSESVKSFCSRRPGADAGSPLGRLGQLQG